MKIIRIEIEKCLSITGSQMFYVKIENNYIQSYSNLEEAQEGYEKIKASLVNPQKEIVKSESITVK